MSLAQLVNIMLYQSTELEYGMGFFGRVGNLLSGYISIKRGSSHEDVLKEQALEEEMNKASPAVKAAARERLSKLKGEGLSPSSDVAEKQEPIKPKKRTL